ncbi:hypothetical protein ACHAXA_000434 [Cyclostephanos tholiformis]|uniref:Uncharacterized protein n=1 Tax=Cyclostephanos tholiformis TaxID=382380 RepID=A0ABD3RVZ1_9STRA
MRTSWPHTFIYCSLRRGQRVQFKVGPPDKGGITKKAYDLTYEGGGLIPPFQKDYLENYIKNQKAKFGDEVFDIFTTSKDQKELEMKIVAAFDRVKENIDRQREKVAAAGGTMDEE